MNPDVITAETQRTQRKSQNFLCGFLCALCVSAVIYNADAILVGQSLSGDSRGAAPAQADQKAESGNRLYQEGQALASKGDYIGARTCYEDGLRLAQERGDKPATANNWLGIGLIKAWQGDNQNAWTLCSRAKQVAEEMQDPVILAKASLCIGYIQEATGQYREAWESYESTFQQGEAEDNHEIIRDVLVRMGNLYYKQGDHAQAAQCFQRALSISEALGDKNGVALACTGIGSLHRDQGAYEGAGAYYQRALRIAEELGNKQAVAAVSNNIGVLFGMQASYREAVEYFQRALQIHKELGQKKEIALALNNMGTVYQRQGRYREATQYYQDTLKITEELGDKSGIAMVLNNIGVMQEHQGAYGLAVESYQRAIKIAEELHDKSKMAALLHNIGNVYGSQRSYDRALEYYQRALGMRREMGDKQGITTTLRNIGLVYNNQGSYKEAAAHYQKALSISQELGDKRETAETLHNIGAMHESEGSYGKAAEHYQKSLQISQTIQSRRSIGFALNGLGSIHLKRQEHAQAVEILQQALAMGEEIKDPIVIWRARHHLANGYEKLDQPMQALMHYQRAVAEIEKMRAGTGTSEGRIGFLADKMAAYEDLIRLLCKLDAENPNADYRRQAYEYAERAKARTFLDLLEESKAGVQIAEGLGPDLRNQESAIQIQLSDLQVRWDREYLKPKPDEKRISALEKQRDAIYEKYEELKNQIRRSHPRYAELKYPEPIRLSETQRLLDEESVLLEYFLGKEASFLFIITQADHQWVRLPGREGIERQIERLRRTIARDQIPNPSAQVAYIRAATGLYRDLVKPGEKWLQGKRRVLIAPDGWLYYLPFQALLTTPVPVTGSVDFKRLPYWVKGISISYIPSASVLKSLREGKKARPDSQKKLLAFADPVYGPERERTYVRVRRRSQNAPTRANGAERGRDVGRLIHSGAEVKQIAQLYPKDRVRLYLRAEASEENVKRERLEDYARVHFAAHGLADENRPQFSSIILARSEGSGEDGYLQMYEIFNLRMNADLVVLSACDSGLGRQVRGEGMVGLTRAFLYAGAESVVVSLWKIDDQSTADLMIKLYVRLEHTKKDQALREAQLEMIGSAYSHPFFWSPFVLYGPQ